MKTVGEISKFYGSYRGASALIKVDKQNVYTLAIPFKEKIQLSGNLAQVSVDSKTSLSGSKLLMRSGLSALAGSSWKSGSAGTAGFLAGVASSVDVTKTKHLIHLVFLDGTRISGNANGSIINLLSNISLNFSQDDMNLHQMQQQEQKNAEQYQLEKFNRFLDDAPRTIGEVTKSLNELRGKAAEYQELSDSGETFGDRESAKGKLNDIQSQIREKEELYSALEERLRIIKRHGDHNAYEVKRKSLEQDLEKQKKNRSIPWISGGFAGLLWLGLFATISDPEMTSEDSSSMIIGTVLFSIYPAYRIFCLLKGKAKMKRLESEYNDLINF